MPLPCLTAVHLRPPPPAVPSSPSSWHLNDSTYSLPICTATGIWEISALCKARQMAGICCSMLRTDWPPLAANPCVGVRAQVIIIKDTNKTHQHVALSHVGKKKKQKCCLWPVDLAQAVCFSDTVLHSSFGPLAVFWKYLCASVPFLLSQGLQVSSSATSFTVGPHPPLPTQSVCFLHSTQH